MTQHNLFQDQAETKRNGGRKRKIGERKRRKRKGTSRAIEERGNGKGKERKGSKN